jgi:hypothetical protein
MYWTEIRKSEHYNLYHSNVLSWAQVIQSIYLIKNKRKKGNRIEIEDDRLYILCQIRNKTLYVINVKVKK